MTFDHRFVSLALAGALAACSSSEPEPEPAAAPPAAPAAEPAPAEAQAEADPHSDHAEVAAEHARRAQDPQPIRALEDGARVFGAEVTDREATALATIVSEPSRFDGQVVKTEGVIAQVCQRMGCWMELAAAEGERAVRVPMAGHSFFLPKDVAGRRATVEGTFEVAELDESAREHLREEGAQAADSALAITATAVIVH